MGDDDRRSGEERGKGRQHEEREGGLLDLLRRVVGPRQPAVLVMEPDGRLRRARERER